MKFYNNNYRSKEKELYSGSIILNDKKHNTSVRVPCFYHAKVYSKKCLDKKIRQYTIDNDKDTDSETASNEKDRTFRMLSEFINKTKKDKKYLNKNMYRKIQVE